MAASQSQTPSSSSNPVRHSRYDIFLSFRGLDTRRKFTDHLYKALMREGYETFRDNEEIERGFDIKPELLKAIISSRMSVVVLSENYSNSTACLFELQNILELCKKSDHFVLPVFYEVDPMDIKKQSKNLYFGEKEVAAEKVKGWTEALREVASMAGMVFGKDSDGQEAEFIEDIVAVLKSKLAGKCMMVDDYLVGMDSRTEDVDSWLKDRSTRFGTKACILVICGMGGIGKTTIAKVVYNSNQDRYDAACFLSNIRDIAKGPDGLLRLQSQLISTLTRKEERKVNHVDDGRERMKYCLSNKRVLLVLDDVDHKDHLTALAGQPDWFTPGSKMIITTRFGNLMKVNDIYEVYRPEKLSPDDSLELFNWHALGQKHPTQKGHMELSKKFVQHCDGLPLALEVLGSSVRRKSLDVWESALQKLAATCDGTILEKLKISYDSLIDDNDKNIFLDIACFFAQKKKSDTITILQGCGYYALAGIHNLADRNLLTIQNEKLEMHRLLQDMGKQIVCRESRFPEKRSRIWHHEDSFSILDEKIGTGEIGGLILDMNMLTNSNTVVFEANTFEKIINLKLLKLSGVQLSGNQWAFPKRLRWLYWRGFPLESFPSDIPLEKLVNLDLRYSNLKRVWEGAKALGSLKILNLSHSPRLENTPDFSGIPNLERLILEACPSLFEVDESLVELQKLQFLNLRDCENLKKLPRDICMVESLVEINLSGCSNLMGAILELGKMKSLQVPHARGTGIHDFLSAVPKSRTQMSLASLPTSLTHLNLSNCNLTDNAFRGDFSSLSKLKKLSLAANSFTSLPEAIKDLTGLQFLDMFGCPRLKQILLLPIGLEKLDVTACGALEKITYETSARIMDISYIYCFSLDYVQNSFKILPVKEVDVELINQIGFFNLDSMANFEAFIVYLQILQEGSIFSTYFPGTEVPRWFSNRNRGPTVSLTMTSSSHGGGIPGMNLCLVYAVPATDWLPEPFEVEVINKSRGIKRSYAPRCYSTPEAGVDMVWLSHWLPGTATFEEGDELQVLFNLNVDGQIKECGVHLLWIREDEIRKYYSTIYHSWDSNMLQSRVFASEDYIQNSFKILPVKEVDVELINQIGFFNLDFMANFEAYIVNLIVWSRKKCPIQILQEGSIFSTYFPGTEVPRWFRNRNQGPTVSLTMTSSSHGRGTPGMNLCLVYTVPEIDWLPEPLEVEVINKSRGIKRSYTPRCYSIPEAGGDIVWLSHWLPGTAIFQEGDELQVLFNLKVDGQIKECGVHLLWIGEDKMQKYYSTIYYLWDSTMFRVVTSEGGGGQATEAGGGGGQAAASTVEDAGGGGGGGGGAATIEDAGGGGNEREVAALITMEMATDANASIKIEDDDVEIGSGNDMKALKITKPKAIAESSKRKVDIVEAKHNAKSTSTVGVISQDCGESQSQLDECMEVLNGMDDLD